MVTSVSENTELTVPLKNLIAMLIAVAAGTGGYFTAMERIGSLENTVQMMHVDVKQNTHFRILWPRGELGSLPADSRQDLLLDSIDSQISRLEERMERVDDLQVRLKLVEQRLGQ